MIHCRELNMDFESKESLFKALKAHKSDIVAFKKAQTYKSCEKGVSITAKPLDYLKLSTQEKSIPLDDSYYYIAVNSTRILDSHLDLHLDGIWNKTTKEQQGKNYLVDSHELSVGNTIAKKEHVEMFTAKIPFSMLGKQYEGETEALIYKIRKDKVIHQIARDWLESGDDIEASVRMQYTDIVFALNSDAKEDVREKKTYDELIKIIANKDDFDSEIMYFWGIKQAKNVMESSLVLFASNDSTGPINDNKQEPSKGTLKTQVVLEGTQEEPPESTVQEPSEDTQKQFYYELSKN